MSKQIDGQMSIFDFIAPEEQKTKKGTKQKKYIPKCCSSCKYWLEKCCEGKKADHDMCDNWKLNDIPKWRGFLNPQEAVKELFSTNRIIGSVLEYKVKNIYITLKESNDRIEKLRSLKGLCGQAWMPEEKDLKEIYGVTGYSSNYAHGLTIRLRNSEGVNLTFGKYIPWDEVDKILMNVKFKINKGELNGDNKQRNEEQESSLL